MGQLNTSAGIQLKTYLEIVYGNAKMLLDANNAVGCSQLLEEHPSLDRKFMLEMLRRSSREHNEPIGRIDEVLRRSGISDLHWSEEMLHGTSSADLSRIMDYHSVTMATAYANVVSSQFYDTMEAFILFELELCGCFDDVIHLNFNNELSKSSMNKRKKYILHLVMNDIWKVRQLNFKVFNNVFNPCIINFTHSWKISVMGE
jgi:hypothetical protein